jgi:hypothetical protein
MLLRQWQHKGTSCNQCLLVCEADVLAGLNGSNRWQQASTTDDAGDNCLNVRVAGNLGRREYSSSSSSSRMIMLHDINSAVVISSSSSSRMP